jgi:hypothetical protein
MGRSFDLVAKTKSDTAVFQRFNGRSRDQAAWPRNSTSMPSAVMGLLK